MKKIFFLSLSFLLFVGCGYKPSSYYAKKVITGTVFVDVDASAEDPKNSVIAKDELIEILVSRLGAKISESKATADVTMVTKMQNVSFSAVGYNTSGYISAYRTNVTILITYKTKEKTGHISVSGNYDFSLDDTTISEVKRFEAIKIASQKAMQDFVSQMAVISFR